MRYSHKPIQSALMVPTPPGTAMYLGRGEGRGRELVEAKLRACRAEVNLSSSWKNQAEPAFSVEQPLATAKYVIVCLTSGCHFHGALSVVVELVRRFRNAVILL